jgi:putative FmdB family regulatory protein
MPTYSYMCATCEKPFDAFHSMSCTDPQVCPVCGAQGKKLLSASSIIFKGSGFYSTDYRDSGYVEAKKRDSDGVGTSASPASGTPPAGTPPPGGGKGASDSTSTSSPASTSGNKSDSAESGGSSAPAPIPAAPAKSAAATGGEMARAA